MNKGTCLFLVLIGAFYSTFLYAECGDDYTSDYYNGDCDFMNEDTHLAKNQAGYGFVEDDKVQELIEQADTFMEAYLSNVKSVTGDIAMRAQGLDLISELLQTEVMEGIAAAIMLSENDQYGLKELYTDAMCQAWWDSVEQFTGVTRECESTSEMLMSLEDIYELDKRRQRMWDIIKNPNLFLGEEWGDIANDIKAIRTQYDELESFGRNIATIDIEAKYQETYSDIETLLTQPLSTLLSKEQHYRQVSETNKHTIQDIVSAMSENYKQLENEDKDELEKLADMSNRAVGRMQANEIGNMLGMQKVQSWAKMKEQYSQQTNLFAIEMAGEQSMIDLEKADTLKRLTKPLGAVTTLGNGLSFGAAQ